MKIVCSSWEREKLINLIDESDGSCQCCPLYEKCKYDCVKTWENEVEWEVNDEA